MFLNAFSFKTGNAKHSNNCRLYHLLFESSKSNSHSFLQKGHLQNAHTHNFKFVFESFSTLSACLYSHTPNLSGKSKYLIKNNGIQTSSEKNEPIYSYSLTHSNEMKRLLFALCSRILLLPFSNSRK